MWLISNRFCMEVICTFKHFFICQRQIIADRFKPINSMNTTNIDLAYLVLVLLLILETQTNVFFHLAGPG